jgi:hypothetical protein
MKFSTILNMLFLAFTDALTTSGKPITKTFRYVGDIHPTNYFDPLGFSKNVDESKVKYFREAELQHGRLAMASMVALPLLDMYNDELAINSLSKLSLSEQAPFWGGVALFEVARMNAGWKNPFAKGNPAFTIKENYQPGNVLNFKDSNYKDVTLERELSNGRLAMLASLGYITQELVTGTPIF